MDQECQPDAIQLLVVRLNAALNAEAKYQAFLELPLDQVKHTTMLPNNQKL